VRPDRNAQPSLRILVAHNVSRSRTGGMSRLMGFVHDQVAAAGHHVAYFCAEDMPLRLAPRWKRLLFPLYLYAHVRAAAAGGERYDIVNVHEPSSAAVVVGRRPLGQPVIVVTTHGVEQRGWELSLEEAKLGREGPKPRERLSHLLLSRWQCAIGLRKADHIFCLNSEDRDYLNRRMHISRERITRIQPGVDPIFGELSRGRDYAQTDRLLFAGTWRKNKGIEDIIPAFTELARRNPAVSLTVLDAGTPVDSIRSTFDPDVRSRIDTASTIDETGTAGVYARSDILIMPSLFEGTPLTLIEGMMSGLPVVTTATCGMKDVVQDEKDGLLIPIRSARAIVAAVERLQADGSLRERLGLAARQKAAEHYSWRQVAAPILEIYERLAQEKFSHPSQSRAPQSNRSKQP